VIQKIVGYWKSLPHPVQAAIMLFAGAASGVIKHAIAQPNACFTSVCWHGYLASALHAGILAVVALYIPANLPKN
jgi:hypothetical protein